MIHRRVLFAFPLLSLASVPAIAQPVNTLPGMTDSSGFPKMWEGTGLDFSQVIDGLVTLAIDRHNDKSRNKTNR